MICVRSTVQRAAAADRPESAIRVGGAWGVSASWVTLSDRLRSWAAGPIRLGGMRPMAGSGTTAQMRRYALTRWASHRRKGC
jgi:hypothetical protein